MDSAMPLRLYRAWLVVALAGAAELLAQAKARLQVALEQLGGPTPA